MSYQVLNNSLFHLQLQIHIVDRLQQSKNIFIFNLQDTG
jgi:hypothetical protein